MTKVHTCLLEHPSRDLVPAHLLSVLSDVHGPVHQLDLIVSLLHGNILHFQDGSADPLVRSEPYAMRTVLVKGGIMNVLCGWWPMQCATWSMLCGVCRMEYPVWSVKWPLGLHHALGLEQVNLMGTVPCMFRNIQLHLLSISPRSGNKAC